VVPSDLFLYLLNAVDEYMIKGIQLFSDHRWRILRFSLIVLLGEEQPLRLRRPVVVAGHNIVLRGSSHWGWLAKDALRPGFHLGWSQLRRVCAHPVWHYVLRDVGLLPFNSRHVHRVSQIERYSILLVLQPYQLLHQLGLGLEIFLRWDPQALYLVNLLLDLTLSPGVVCGILSQVDMFGPVEVQRLLIVFTMLVALLLHLVVVQISSELMVITLEHDLLCFELAMRGVTKLAVHVQLLHCEVDVLCLQEVSFAVPHNLLGFLQHLLELVLQLKEQDVLDCDFVDLMRVNSNPFKERVHE